MSDWFIALFHWLGLNEPKTVTRKRRVETAVRQRKEAYLRLDRAIREVGVSRQRK